MPLVERDDLVARLHSTLGDVGRGRGGVVVVSGEAGAGKTALVRAVLTSAVWGYCENLSTPRPLGPFRDIAAQLWQVPAARPDALALADRLLRWMRDPGPPLVVEDAHWIDTASADVLRFLGRRIAGTSGMLVVTLRDEVSGDAPVRAALGDLASVEALTRIVVPPLSEAGVREMIAGTGLDVDGVLRLTNGNAFLVSAIAAAPGKGLAGPVRDSVTARLHQLPAGSRALAELLSVVPGRVPAELIDADWQHLDAATSAGLLDVDGTVVEFRHELVRLAIEHELSPERRRALHDEVLRRLNGLGIGEPAEIAHHARRAHLLDVALASETEAAVRASAFGSHREAATHFRRAVEDARRIAPPAEQVRLLVQLAAEENAIGQEDQAREAAEEAVRISSGLDDRHLRSAAMRALCRLVPNAQQAHQLARTAVELCEPLGPSAELAAAYGTLATERMLARDLTAAVTFAGRAQELAEAAGDVPTTVIAANAVGSAMLLTGDADGQVPLRRAIHLAAVEGLDSEVGRAYLNLVSASGEARLYGLSAAAHREALSYFTARDLDGMAAYTSVWHARCLFEQGEWDDASEQVDALLDGEGTVTAITGILAHYLRARLRVRRGEPGVSDSLAEARRIAEVTNSLQRIAPVAAAQAEAQWLGGAAHDTGLLGDTYRLAVERANPWAIGELGFWLWRLGELSELPPDAAYPFRLHVEGDLAGAAAAWTELGCPYEAAEAWAETADEARLRQALDVFTSLRAVHARRRVARRLREIGVRSVPRGPRPSTGQHPHGLTDREAEVLGWLRTGHTDHEIAAALHLSVRTVGHHVAAILRKTGTRSRRDLRSR